jgi:regulator of sigma E protease
VTILWFVLILMVLVLVHEAGHMVVAKWCGMRVERFSIFFGRPLASFRRGETEYAIGWLPLGGYVKISGMTRGEEMPPEHENRAYYAMPAWRKIATILAGPAVNIVLAIPIFAVIFWIGVPILTPTGTVAGVQQDSAAQRAGIEPGDEFVAIDGMRVAGDPERVRDALQSGAPGETVRLTLERDGRTIQRTAELQVLEDPTGDPRTDPETGRPLTGLGFNFDVLQGPRERLGFLEGLEEGADFTWYVVEVNAEAIGNLGEARDQVSSIVGVGAVFNEVAEDDITTILRLIGVISLALGIFNLLPILPLDGGHILFAIIEKLKGSAISKATYERTSFVGLAILLFIFVIALQNDIGRITGEGFQIDR